MQDHKIVDIIKEQVDEADLNQEFYGTQRTLTAPKGCGLRKTTQLFHALDRVLPTFISYSFTVLL
jgi:hypothetical protein